LFILVSVLVLVTKISLVTGHLSERSFVRNVVVQIPKNDAKPNPNPSPSPNPMPIRFRQVTLQTSELSPDGIDKTLLGCKHTV